MSISQIFIDRTEKEINFISSIEFDDDPISLFPAENRKVPKSLEDIVRITKFNKSEIRLLYKGFKQVRIRMLVSGPEAFFFSIV